MRTRGLDNWRHTEDARAENTNFLPGTDDKLIKFREAHREGQRSNAR
ncbi:MAG: hypothetical protein FD151_721 [bacterium]|nr:MAG: hypothetical protein FD151_721 [bacterium]